MKLKWKETIEGYNATTEHCGCVVTYYIDNIAENVFFLKKSMNAEVNYIGGFKTLKKAKKVAQLIEDK